MEPSPASPEEAAADAKKLAELSAEVEKLRARLAKCTEKYDAANRACMAGISAAREHTKLLHRELKVLREAPENFDNVRSANVEMGDVKMSCLTRDESPNDPEYSFSWTIGEDGPHNLGWSADISSLWEEVVMALKDHPAMTEDRVRSFVDYTLSDDTPIGLLMQQGPRQEQGNLTVGQSFSVLDDQQKSKDEALKIDLRTLRHELGRWRHQAESLEQSLPKEEEELRYSKSKLTHTMDILESTRTAHAHKLIEAEDAAVKRSSLRSSAKALKNIVPLHNGGHGGVEAFAERGIRGKFEHRNDQLSEHQKHLVVDMDSQQQLIHRLEAAISKQEQELEQKNALVAKEISRNERLKMQLQKNSERKIAAAIGAQRSQVDAAAVRA